MLYATEETKRTLQIECDEARFALKPWPIETTVIRHLDKNTCTCEEGIATEERAEEIAAEIGKTLLQSQQLREKLAANLYRERQNARKPDVREIYAKKSQPLKESNANPKSQNTSEKERNLRNERRRSASQHRASETRKSVGRYRSASTIRSKDADENVVGRRIRQPGKPILEPSKDNVLAQMTSYKPKPHTNFILANKLSVKSAKRNEESAKSQGDLRKIGISSRPVTTADKSTSTIKNDEIETLSELDRLIKKFDFGTTINSSNLRSNCPIHAANASTVIEEKVITTVDAVEGLDRFGVPSQLLKILKTYHSYIKKEVFNDTSAVAKKHQESTNNFMENFERISKKSSESHLKKHQELLNNLSVLYADVFKPNLSDHELKVSKSKFIALDLFYNECNIKNIAGDLKLNKSNNELTNDHPFDMRNWISNGIWNYLCVPDLKGIFGSYCTRYSDRNQLLIFYDLIQKVQRKVYETELIELLILTVIPKLKEFFDPSSKEYIEIYKMIHTVIQIPNPKVPVLAKTDCDD